jgi:transposase
MLDPERRGREISKTISEIKETTTDKKDVDLSNYGKLVFLSNEKIDPNTIIPLYYTHQISEKMFSIAKDNLNILPLRTHSEPNFKCFMMILFLSLILYCVAKIRLCYRISIEKALSPS